MSLSAGFLPPRPDLITAVAAEQARADAGTSALSEYAADLARETDRWLQREPGRLPWIGTTRRLRVHAGTVGGGAAAGAAGAAPGTTSSSPPSP